MAEGMNQTKLIAICDQILNTIKNCGSGAAGSPGFQPGNTCARGGGGGSQYATSKLFPSDPGKPELHNTASSMKEHRAKGSKTQMPFEDSLNHGKGVDKAIGGKTIRPTSGAEFEAAIKSKGNAVIIAPLKGEKRATEKVRDKYGGDWTRLTDVVRATVAVDSMSDLSMATKATAEHMERNGFKLMSVDNRMAKPTDSGYRDINTNWKSKDGYIVELQINTKAMIRAKEGRGHKLYEVERKITEKHERAGTKPGKAEAEQIRILQREQRKLYGAAWAESNQ